MKKIKDLKKEIYEVEIPENYKFNNVKKQELNNSVLHLQLQLKHTCKKNNYFNTKELVKEIALKKGIKIGDIVFDKFSKQTYKVAELYYIECNTDQHAGISQIGKNTTYSKPLDNILTFEEYLKELDFKKGDKCFNKDTKKYLGEIKEFRITNGGNILCVFDINKDVVCPIYQCINKIAISCKTKEDFEFIYNKHLGRNKYTFDEKYTNVFVNKDYVSLCNSVMYKNYLTLSIDEYCKTMNIPIQFITNDKKNIYDGMESYYVLNNKIICYKGQYIENFDNKYSFSSKQSAQNYLNNLIQYPLKYNDLQNGNYYVTYYENQGEYIFRQGYENYMNNNKFYKGHGNFTNKNSFYSFRQATNEEISKLKEYDTKFEIGKWYYVKLNNIDYYCLYNITNNYNYTCVGFKNNEWNDFICVKESFTEYNWELADMFKVKELLLNEAKKRYNINDVLEYNSFNVGEPYIAQLTNFNISNHINDCYLYIADAIHFIHGIENGTINACLFNKYGKWANVIKKFITVSEDNKKLYENDMVYIVKQINTNEFDYMYPLVLTINNINHFKEKVYKIFLSKEKALEFIENEKSKLLKPDSLVVFKNAMNLFYIDCDSNKTVFKIKSIFKDKIVLYNINNEFDITDFRKATNEEIEMDFKMQENKLNNQLENLKKRYNK